ncbi:SEL1-like repeat protein [Methylocystis rosea]|uniref:Peptidoglycan-binding protein n=1 Tax=Methylocystis rosea TaxID=173366 RepID=A0A3G8M5K4_9HYPH|nr:SEL1-like repeat protein [Methylocystis rosea]AZG77151.1 peptidoglycan-binding protein [Methylocystis rosea]
MTKAQFPDQGRPNSESPEDKRETGHWGGNLPNAEEPSDENRGVDEDAIWRSIAALSKSRIESQLGEQPAANARPIRSALAELEARLARLSGEHRGADVEKTLRGLDQHLADIAGRLDDNAARGRAAKPAETSGASAGSRNASFPDGGRGARSADAAARPILEAFAKIPQRPRALDDALGGSENASGSRFEALQRSIDSVTQGLDSFREDAAERGDQQLVMMRQIENVRRELQDMAQAIGELAPRASVAAIETAMGDLRQGIESQRGRGVPDETLAPAERIIGELRAVIEDLDPTPIVRNLRADVETIGFRLEKLQNGDVANASAVRDLARETHEIKEQLTALMARPLPLERIETRIIDVTQRVDALALSRGASGADLGEVVKAIRSIVAAETGKGLETFNKRLERLARKLDVVVEQTAAARFDEIGARIDELGKTLAQRIDRGAANMAPLEALITTLAKKIDTALDGDGHASAFEEIGRRFDRFESRVGDSAPTESLARIEAMLAEQNAERQFADLAQRIDELRQTIAARLENPGGVGDSEHFAALENLVRGLDRKMDAAFAADARDIDLQAVERQLAQLSFKIDRLDDPFSAPRFGEQNTRLDEIVDRLDRMHAAFAQRVEEDGSVEKREGELAALVGSLADRMKQSADPTADDGALKSLETQIGALAQRLERIDAGSGALIGFESKINDLFARLEDTRSATTQAAEAAVRRAATEVLRDAAGVQPAAVRVAVQRELSELLRTQDASGQRTNETLTAVHQTLERVVKRLGVVDDEWTENRSVARRSPDAELGVEPCGDDTRERVGAPAADASDADGEALAPVDPMEFLLPVGEGGVERREPFLAPPGTEADQAAHRSSIQLDFIAAARRAAQTPAAEADAQSAEAARHAGQAGEKPQGAAVVNFSALIQDRKRPLLLGIGAVMLLIGAYQIARMEGQGGLTLGPSLRQQEAKAPAKAVRPALSPEKRLASNGASSPVAQRPTMPGPVLKELPSDMAPAASVARPIAAQRNIDPTPTGTIEAPPLSPGDALATIERLAVEGNPAAQYEMGARLVEGRGAARDAKAAAHWFEKAAGMGLALAQYRLGSMYERGVGVARDYARARLWYERAAESGNARAMHNVAVLLAEGGDGKPDYAAAAEWFRRAAEYGIRDSQFNLGILYARGLGISRDLQQSYVWFSAAADQGDEDAAKKRDEIGARLDSKELAAAKALAAAFRAKTPTSEANDAPAIRTGGGEGEREQTPVKPAPKSPSGKPRVSQL